MEIREYNRKIDRENWALCQEIYRKSNVPTMSRHIHGKKSHKSHEIRDDLAINGCRGALGPYWADRI